jgi:very-short-patch-repair endonuclease
MDSIEFSRAASTLRRFSDTDKNLVSRLRKEGTKAEDKLWSLIRKDQIPGVHFRRQHKIGQFVVDFFSIKCHLAIEVDGEIHARQIQEDEARTQWLNSFGIRVLRFSNADVIVQPARVLCEIEKAVQEQRFHHPNENGGN